MRPLLCLCVLACAASPCAAQGRRVVAYYTEWSVYDRKYDVAQVPADKLTHLIYAFARLDAKGDVSVFDAYAATDKFYPGDKWDKDYLRGNFRQLQNLKARHKHLKTLIAVGGWTLSGPFSDVAAAEATRARFARSAVAFMTRYGFDGVDVDWEYPVSGGLGTNKTRKEDKRNYTLLLKELRQVLDAQGKKDGRPYLLTVAAPAGPTTSENLELPEVAKLVDWFNLMSYDFHGGWSPLTHFNAPLYAVEGDPTADETVRRHFNVDSAVRSYLKREVPKDKVVVGVPFYGRGWRGVTGGKDGLFAKRGPGLPKGTWEDGLFDYKDLAANYVGKYRRHWHDEAKVPWLYDEKAGVTISYDDEESMRIKARYVADGGLGGVMAWELSGDDAKGTLLGALHGVLRPAKR